MPRVRKGNKNDIKVDDSNFSEVEKPEISSPETKSESVGDTAEPAIKRIKFRNYQPYDVTLRNESSIPSTSISLSDETKNFPNVVKSSKEMIKDELEREDSLFEAKKDEERHIVQKPHADLKALIEPQLLKLKKRTTRAIVEILKEKLRSES